MKTGQARRQLNWNGGGMDSQYIVLSELLSDQAAFITSPKTSLANYWGALPPALPPVSTGLKQGRNYEGAKLRAPLPQEKVGNSSTKKHFAIDLNLVFPIC